MTCIFRHDQLTHAGSSSSTVTAHVAPQAAATRLESTRTPRSGCQPANLHFASAAVTHVLPGDGEANVSPASMNELSREFGAGDPT